MEKGFVGCDFLTPDSVGLNTYFNHKQPLPATRMRSVTDSFLFV
jgi:hypothetical protein